MDNRKDSTKDSISHFGEIEESFLPQSPGGKSRRELGRDKGRRQKNRPTDFPCEPGQNVFSQDQTISFRFFSGRIFTTFLAGLALKVVSSPVKGLIPLRALVAGFRTTVIFVRPGTV
jgi:hypothetical protein